MGNRMVLKKVDKSLRVRGKNINFLKINYGSKDWMHSPTEDRKEELQKRANFECACERCLDPMSEILADSGLKEECAKCKGPLILDKCWEDDDVWKICVTCGIRVQFTDPENAEAFLRETIEISALGKAGKAPSAQIMEDLFPILSKIHFAPQNRKVYTLALMFLLIVTEGQGPNQDSNFSDGAKERTRFAIEKCMGALEAVGLVYTNQYRDVLKRAVKLYRAMGHSDKAAEAEKKLQKSMLQFGW